MVVSSFLFKALISLLLGALIGAERERSQKNIKIDSKDSAGIRTFVLITMLGYFSAYINNGYIDYFLVSTFIGLITLIITSYTYQAYIRDKNGLTSELAAISSFLIGCLTFYESTYAVILGIVVALILSGKKYIHNFINKINQEEYYATLKFAIIAFIVLPILPKEPLDSWGVLNLYNIWLMVVFISGISFIGYILTKIIGINKGIGITGLIGGLVSSTAVTTSMSNQSKKNPKVVLPFVLAIIAASGMMVIRVLIEVSVLNHNLIIYLVKTLGIMIGINLVILFIIWIKPHKKDIDHILELESPFQFIPALKFGLFFLFILSLIALANHTNIGESGFYITALISGLADVDAITISMSQLANKNPEMLQIATKTITIAVIANTIVKGVIVYIFGNKNMAKYVIASIISITIGGIIGILIV